MGELGLPPGPDLALNAVTVCPILQRSINTENACCGRSEIAEGPSPSVSMLDDEPMIPQTGQGRCGASHRYTQLASRRVDRRRVLTTEECVDLPGEMSEPSPREEVVPNISKFTLQHVEKDRSFGKNLPRGAGVINWLCPDCARTCGNLARQAPFARVTAVRLGYQLHVAVLTEDP
jgi:hypothetical protein